MGWNVAKVVSYDEENGYHGVKYASGYNGRLGDRLDVGQRNVTELSRFQFQSADSQLILAAREVYVIYRETRADESSDKSAFDMEHLLSDGNVQDTDDGMLTRSRHLTYVGKRVESNFKSTEWHAYTVLSASDVDGENTRYLLVSDDGDVVRDVPSGQIRGLDDDEQPSSEADSTRASAAGRGREGRVNANRAFPFLTVRRQAEGERNSSNVSSQKSRGVLKRSWSALSPIESMCPVEVTVSGNSQYLEKRSLFLALMI